MNRVGYLLAILSAMTVLCVVFKEWQAAGIGMTGIMLAVVYAMYVCREADYWSDAEEEFRKMDEAIARTISLGDKK